MAIRKIDLMHKRYGKTIGMICGNCDHFFVRTWDKRYFKCEVYGDSSSEATDWAKRYAACGLFNKVTRERNVVRLVTPERDIKIVDGQMSLL